MNYFATVIEFWKTRNAAAICSPDCFTKRTRGTLGALVAERCCVSVKTCQTVSDVQTADRW